jgi:hypothetical protein
VARFSLFDSGPAAITSVFGALVERYQFKELFAETERHGSWEWTALRTEGENLVSYLVVFAWQAVTRATGRGRINVEVWIGWDDGFAFRRERAARTSARDWSSAATYLESALPDLAAARPQRSLSDRYLWADPRRHQ